MCVIMVKPKGKEMVSKEIRRQMWDRNKDGAGFMYLNKDKKVIISKGFMTFDDFEKGLSSVKDVKNIKDTPMVLHFRITTHGGTSPENTHPFPISSVESHLQALDVSCNLAMAHNGVINSVETSATLSDTMMFIKTIVSPLSKLDKEFLTSYEKFIKYGIGASKLAFLDNTGKITTIGDFKDVDGYLYSNTNHVPYVPTKTTYSSHLYRRGKANYKNVNKDADKLKDNVIYEASYGTLFYFDSIKQELKYMTYDYGRSIVDYSGKLIDFDFIEADLKALDMYGTKHITAKAKEVFDAYYEKLSATCSECAIDIRTGDYVYGIKNMEGIKPNVVYYIDYQNFNDNTVDLVDTYEDILMTSIPLTTLDIATQPISSDEALIYADYMVDYYKKQVNDVDSLDLDSTGDEPVMGTKPAKARTFKLKKVAKGVELLYIAQDGVSEIVLETTNNNWFYDIHKRTFYFLTPDNKLRECENVIFADETADDVNSDLMFLQGTRKFNRRVVYEL